MCSPGAPIIRRARSLSLVTLLCSLPLAARVSFWTEELALAIRQDIARQRRLVQVFERSRCTIIYKVPVLKTGGLILSSWAPTVVLQKGFCQVLTIAGASLSVTCQS